MVCGGNKLSRGTSGSGNGVGWSLDLRLGQALGPSGNFWEHDRARRRASGHPSLHEYSTAMLDSP